MFPLQRGNELVIQFSRIPDQESKISSQDPIPKNNDDDYGDSENKRITGNKKKKMSYINNPNENKKKKMMIHRETERQRRQDMASLYSSLRSLLPLDYIKGKRSVSDHMNEAVSYVKHLEKNIKELGDKRDLLKKQSLDDDDERKQKLMINFSVHENNNGVVGIEIMRNYKDERFKLSKFLELVLEQGLEVVTCLSTQVNGTILHSINGQVNSSNNSSADLTELRRKIASFIS